MGCFKTPDQAQAALSELNGQNVNNGQLQICHYELKEFRDIADEETKDKFGFQRFKELNYQQRQWNDITSKDEFQYKLIELLKNLPQQAGRPFNQMPMQRGQNMGGNRQGQPYRNNSAGRTGQRTGYQGQNQMRGNSMEGRHGGMPMGGQLPMAQGVQSMPAPSGAQIPNQQMSQQEQRFYTNTLKLVPSIVAANPHMKQQ